MISPVLREFNHGVYLPRIQSTAIRFAVLAQCCLTLLLLPSQSIAQTGEAQKDPAAVAAINSALTSMGGQPAISAIQDATFVGQYYGNSTSSSASGQVTWQSIGISVRCATSSSTGTAFFTGQNSSGSVEDTSGNVTAMDARMALTVFPFHLPGAVFLYLLNDPNHSLVVIQDTSSTPNLTHFRTQVQMSDPSLTPVTQQDWYVDMTTGLPTRVDYYLPNTANPALDGTASVLFTSWQRAPSSLVPHQIQILNNGQPVSSVTFGVPQFNQGLLPSIFQLP